MPHERKQIEILGEPQGISAEPSNRLLRPSQHPLEKRQPAHPRSRLRKQHFIDRNITPDTLGTFGGSGIPTIAEDHDLPRSRSCQPSPGLSMTPPIHLAPLTRKPLCHQRCGLSTSSRKVANPLTATDGCANATEAADGTLWLIPTTICIVSPATNPINGPRSLPTNLSSMDRCATSPLHPTAHSGSAAAFPQSSISASTEIKAISWRLSSVQALSPPTFSSAASTVAAGFGSEPTSA
jgi:hypothetical protein